MAEQRGDNGMVNIGNEWDKLLEEEFKKEYYLTLRQQLKQEYQTHTVYPAMENLFNALKYTSYSDVKVVILGQDPYPGPGQAHGLSFSVLPGVATPRSLANIYRELNTDVGCFIPDNGYLVPWTQQGVMLLNAVLSVRQGEPNSHKGLGWEQFTNRVIQLLNEREKPVLFLLWGRNAKEKLPLITNPHHFVLQAAHPSPMSADRGFFGCRHFSKANEIMRRIGEQPIDWQIPNLADSAQ